MLHTKNKDLENTIKHEFSPKPKERFALLTAYELAVREISSLAPDSSTSPNKLSRSKLPLLPDAKSPASKLLRIRAKERQQEQKGFKIYKEQISQSFEQLNYKKQLTTDSVLEKRLSHARLFRESKERLESQHSLSALSKLNDRLERSNINHSQVIEHKKQFCLKTKPRSQSVNKAIEDDESYIAKFIIKRQSTEARKEKFLKDLHTKIERKKIIKESQLNKAKERYLSQQKLFSKKKLEFDARFKSVNEFKKIQQMRFEEKLKEKAEKNKIKELAIVKKCEKRKNHELKIKEEIIKRILNEKETLERLKEKKELENSRIRAGCIKRMIEKEKVSDVLEFFRKAPNMSSLRLKMKELNLDRQATTPK